MDRVTTEAGALTTISYERYISREYVQQEKARLWPRVWQIACREEEIPNPGDYVTYDVADSSVIVVRTKTGEIRAHHNVCLHRGRRLTSGCGKANLFHCGYHGWKYDLDGQNIFVQDPDDWGGALDCANLKLKPVRVDTWGGFVFVDFRGEGESLMEFLEVIPDALGPYEYEKMRYRFYTTIKLPCNWKVALEAFIEGYHVAATHPQMLSFMGDDRTTSGAHGKHSNFSYPHMDTAMGMPAPRTGMPWPNDPRPNIMYFFEYYEENLKSMFSTRDYEATRELMEKVPDGTDAFTTFGMAVELGRAAAEAEGVGYPAKATYEHMGQYGADWHIFPNCATLPWFDGGLWYRSRPNGDDPDTCIFDVWSLVRYAPGKEPALERSFFDGIAGNTLGAILNQDIANMGEVQKGMKTRAITEGLVNPNQEQPILNFQRNLDRYIDTPVGELV